MRKVPHRIDCKATEVGVALASLHLKMKLHALQAKAGFDPSQPRVPAGNSDGGQWAEVEAGTGLAPNLPHSMPSRLVTVDTGKLPWSSVRNLRRRDGSVAGRTIRMRDGGRIIAASPESTATSRHVVSLPGGATFLFENENGTQTVYDPKGRIVLRSAWSTNGPVLQPTAQAASYTSRQLHEVMEAGRSLYNWLSTLNDDHVRACLAFRAREYTAEKPDAELLFSGLLSRPQVEVSCRRLQDVQRMTDDAAEEAGNPKRYKSAAAYGTAVHVILRDKIRSGDYPELEAEVSLMKELAVPFAPKGSVRIDVVEDSGMGPICIYDIKTGKRGLSAPRSLEFAERLLRNGLELRPIIVTEVRPFE